MKALHVTIWNEFIQERENAEVARLYPRGLHQVLADMLGKHDGLEVQTATLDQPGQGLPPGVLDKTDVLIWWGHAAHEAVKDDLAIRVQERVIANGVFWARPQGRPGDVPRHVPAAEARQKISASGPSVHDAAGHLRAPKT